MRRSSQRKCNAMLYRERGECDPSVAFARVDGTRALYPTSSSTLTLPCCDARLVARHDVSLSRSFLRLRRLRRRLCRGKRAPDRGQHTPHASSRVWRAHGPKPAMRSLGPPPCGLAKRSLCRQYLASVGSSLSQCRQGGWKGSQEAAHWTGCRGPPTFVLVVRTWRAFFARRWHRTVSLQRATRG